MLELRGLGKVYPNGAVAVSDVNLTVAPGEFVSLLGSSGSGKTTTLRMVAGFERPTSGDVLLGGRSLRDVGAHWRPINTVFQDYALFPHLDVRRNVEFGLRAHKVATGERERRVGEVLEKVQLTALADRLPGQLSGGQRQRVALARALVLQPKVLLLDERSEHWTSSCGARCRLCSSSSAGTSASRSSTSRTTRRKHSP